MRRFRCRRSVIVGSLLLASLAAQQAGLVMAFAMSIPRAPSERQSLSTGQHAAEIEDSIDRWFHEAMQYVYMDRPSDALRLAEAMKTVAPDDPRPYLMMARVLRLDVPDQNFERNNMEAQVAPIDSILEISLQKSQKILDADPNSIAGHLYHGWGLMFQSQLRALADQYWGAGRKAKASKNHIDRVLEMDPENADAQLILGAFLYFADTMPGMAKIASFLVRIPGGDMQRGESLLRSATDGWGYGRYDAHSLMGVVKLGFEGDFENARGYFSGMDSLFYRNVRMLEPIAVIDLFLPEHLHNNMPHLEQTVLVHEQDPEPWVRKATARLRLYLALTQQLSGHLDEAQASLELLIQSLPANPDWLERSVRLSLADLYLLRGDTQKARAVLESTTDEELHKRLAYVLEDDAAASAGQQQSLMQLQPWIRALYAGRYAEVAEGLASWGDDPLALFYQAELELLRGRPAEAIEPLHKFLSYDTPERLRWYRYLAMLRLAEAFNRTGHHNEAKSMLDQAIDYHSDRDLMRHVTKARRRWFEKAPSG